MGILRRLRDRIFEASSILEQGGSGESFSGESFSGESYSDESNSGEWKSEVYLAQIKFDLNGDKARTEKESLGKVFGFFTQMDQAKMQEAQQFSLAFDAADAVWLVNPNQTPPFSIEVNQKRIQDWIAFMLDWEKLLEERALLPGQVLDDQSSNQGFSLKALMQNPPNFSLREDTDIFKIFEAYIRPIRPNTEIINRGNSLMDYILGKDNDPIFALYVN